MTEQHEPYVGGRVVSADPLITYSKRSSGWPLGLAGARPEAFEGKPALHLLGFSFSIEDENECARLTAALSQLSERLPQSAFVCLTNSEYEAYLLTLHGVRSMACSQAIFLDEKIFCPVNVPQRFDAIYNARLIPMKRHELAREIASLGLLYDVGPPEEPPNREAVQALLPRAAFLNHEVGEGAYRQFTIDECAQHVASARVGLCLSKVEGMPQAAIEYLLCGLPVVSTRSVGGRDRYFLPPFCRVVADDAVAVAAAVTRLARREIPKSIVRSHIMHLLSFDRHNFVIAVNKLVQEVFGLEEHFVSFAPFQAGLTRWRPVLEAMAPLQSAHG